MGLLAVLAGSLVVLALVMYWIFSATARHAEVRAQVLAEPGRRAASRPRRP